MVCGKKKASAPFKKLPRKQDFLFGKKYIPADFVFPDDPSHLSVKQARQFLEHIRKRQRKAPDDVFRFCYWLNNEGELADPVVASPEVSEVEGEEVEGTEARDGGADDDSADNGGADNGDTKDGAQNVGRGEDLGGEHDKDGDGGSDGTAEVEDLLPVIHYSAKAQEKADNKVTKKPQNQNRVATPRPSQTPKSRQEGKLRSEGWTDTYNCHLTIQPKLIVQRSQLCLGIGLKL